MPENTPLIQMIGLKKYFNTPKGYLHAVDDINLSIYRGKTLGLVGESGCGKSTLGRLMLNLIPATEGSVLYDSEDILKYNRKQMKQMRKKMQIIFQDPYSSLDPRKSVHDLIAEPLVINRTYKRKSEREERISQLMDMVGLAPRLRNTYPHELDGGRRQRIGIARALSITPEFVVCDEPVSALDVSIQAQILNLLMDLQEQMKLTYVFITHDLSVVKHISDDIAVMYLGQCVEKAPAKELYRNPLHPYTKALISAIPIPKINRNLQEREILAGEIVSPINPSPGCRFAPRCKYCDPKICVGYDLQLKEVEKDHLVMCPMVTDK